MGVVIRNPQGRVLLIERGREPWGWAGVAGHVDGDVSEAGEVQWEVAAKREVGEEVGLKDMRLTIMGGGKKDNKCRRVGGVGHEWVIFGGRTGGEPEIEKQEVKAYRWADGAQLEEMSERSQAYREGKVSEADWEKEPGLELVWQEWLIELGILSSR